MSASAGSLLLVEDDESVALTLAAVLRKGGYDVRPQATVAGALAALNSQAFDVVVTDLRLGGAEDGLTLLTAAKERDQDVVAILLTGYVSAQSAIAAVRLGAWAYLTKPCGVEELRLTIEHGLEHRRRLQALRQRAEAAEAARAEAEAARDWLRTVIQVMPHGVAIADAAGRLLMCNQATYDSWGITAPARRKACLSSTTHGRTGRPISRTSCRWAGRWREKRCTDSWCSS